MAKNRPVIVSLVITLVSVQQPAFAQVEGDVESIIKTMVISFAFLIITIIALMLIRKIAGNKRDSISSGTGLDLMTLRQKGLLSPEELEKVSKSIARQMEQKEAERRKASARPTPEALLLDPEVRRLQALAKARDAAMPAEQAPIVQNEPAVSEKKESVINEPANLSSTSIDERSTEATEEDVVLPPEVQQLADAGVLTEEEVENVKRRLRERKNAGS